MMKTAETKLYPGPVSGCFRVCSRLKAHTFSHIILSCPLLFFKCESHINMQMSFPKLCSVLVAEKQKPYTNSEWTAHTLESTPRALPLWSVKSCPSSQSHEDFVKTRGFVNLQNWAMDKSTGVWAVSGFYLKCLLLFQEINRYVCDWLHCSTLKKTRRTQKPCDALQRETQICTMCFTVWWATLLLCWTTDGNQNGIKQTLGGTLLTESQSWHHFLCRTPCLIIAVNAADLCLFLETKELKVNMTFCANRQHVTVGTWACAQSVRLTAAPHVSRQPLAPGVVVDTDDLHAVSLSHAQVILSALPVLSHTSHVDHLDRAVQLRTQTRRSTRQHL